MTTSTPLRDPHPTLFDRPVGLIRISSPLGRIELTSDGVAVTGLQIERDGQLPLDGYRDSPIDLLLAASDQIAEYFDGDRTRFDLPLAVQGTPFQQRIWAALAVVPYGNATTYGRLGGDAGAGIAGRAVGGAVRANPAPLLIPCHRVLSTAGRISGYSQGSGIPTKQWLLTHEGIPWR